MTTVAPSKVREFSPTSLEKIAYKSVESIPTREPNDQNRLGYNVWIYLSTRQGTLAQAIKLSGARMLLPEAEVVKIVREFLVAAGVPFE